MKINDFSQGCELRIGKRKLNLCGNDLLYKDGNEIEYCIITHWYDEKTNNTKSWIIDKNWIVPHLTFNDIQNWSKKLEAALLMPVLDLDVLKDYSSYYDKIM